LPSVVVALRRLKGEQAQRRLELGAAYEDHGLVCAREDGSPMRPHTISVTFPRLVRKAGLPPVRFHDLRDSHATHLLRQREHPKIVAERLGHSSVAITIERYSHVIEGMQEEAARRLDARLGTAIGG
jgi:integrase